MEVFKQIKQFQEHLSDLHAKKTSIGFVPTMGALHAGHCSLITNSKRENDIVVCSIFVNPAQFENKADLEKYPRPIESDLEKLSIYGCDIVFMPEEEEMYPAGETACQEHFDFGHLDAVMEGKYRPGHFNGVATIVSKLFNIVQPDRAYFGEKDYQQLLIVKHIVKKKKLPVKVVGCPVIREDDGLAISSRNKRLTEEQRENVPFIYQTLRSLKNIIPEMPVAKVKQLVQKKFKNHPFLNLEYFEIVEVENLKSVSEWNSSVPTIGCIAVYAGDVRLIDNFILFP